jgi:hypothetical protein
MVFTQHSECMVMKRLIFLFFLTVLYRINPILIKKDYFVRERKYGFLVIKVRKPGFIIFVQDSWKPA